MISAAVYLIIGIATLIFSVRVYLLHSAEKVKNPFTTYLMWSTFFITISYLKSVFIVMAAIYLSRYDLLFWADFIGRILFYCAGIFAIQIPLYKFYPKSKKRLVFSYLAGILGVALAVYQLFNRNIPTVNSAGIVDWRSNLILVSGVAIIVLSPWAATSFIFIKEFINSNYKLIKSFLLGTGFFLICIGGTLQDFSSNVAYYVLFGVIMALGFLLVYSGMFYNEE